METRDPGGKFEIPTPMLSRVMCAYLEVKQSVRHAALGQFTYAQDHSLLKEGQKNHHGLVTGFTGV